jgi:hypothetical protein
LRTRRSSPFYLTEDAFDSIPISVATDLKSEPESRECRVKMIRVIDEKRRVVDVVFLAELT